MTINNKRLTKKPSILGLIQVGAAFTLLFSIASLFDQYHRYLELLAHFKLQYLIITSFCAGIFMLLKSFKCASALLLAALINATFVVPWYFTDSTSSSANIQTELTILHSNVLSSNERFDDFIKLINQQNPDLFVMQEVNQRWLTEINTLKQTYPHQLSIPRNDNFGIALFSKRPFTSIQQFDSGSWQLPSIKANLSVAGHTITVITTHPLPPIGEAYFDARNEHINEIADFSRNHQGPLIVIGDFNITMFSNDYSTLTKDTHLRNARQGFGLLPTWPTQLLPFMIPIDHCLVSPHFTVKDISVGHDIGSDHLPLVVTLGLMDIKKK